VETSSLYLDKCFSLNNYHDGFIDEFYNEDEDDSSKNKLLLNQVPKNGTEAGTATSIRNYARQCHVPLVLFYILIKLVYLIISISIFGIIDLIFKFNSSFYVFGYKMIKNMYFTEYDEKSYFKSDYFPRVVLCRVHNLEGFAKVVEHEFQCALPSNFINEKLFIFLWFWFCLMVVFNIYSLFKWSLILILRKSYIEEMLTWPFKYNYNIRRYIGPFVHSYLRSEGFLVLMLIKSNTQDWHCRVILRHLWKYYIMRQRQVNDLNETDAYHINTEYCGNKNNKEKNFITESLNEFENKSPVSEATLKCANRRKLDLHAEQLTQLTPSSIIRMDSNDNRENIVSHGKNVLFKIPKEDRFNLTEL
jgi:hypothetical protein